MNKNLIVALVFSIFCFTGYLSVQGQTSVWNGQISPIEKGSGTESDPYWIETAEQFAYLSTEDAKNKGFLSAYFKLVSNIDLNNLPWTPFGTAAFTGVVHSNGYVVKNGEVNIIGTPDPADWDGNLGYDFESWKRNWTDASQATHGKTLYEFRDGNIRFWTEAGTGQRPKLKTVTQRYKTGVYSWRVYIPQMEMHKKVSIGAFLYYDDYHEVDFEIGQGKADVRSEYHAKADEVLMYLTSQGNPWHQSIHPIKSERWYDLSMSISETEDQQYLLVWLLDGKEIDRVKLEYGKEIPFGIYCSLENLEFMGDDYSSREHYVLFNKVGFTPR